MTDTAMWAVMESCYDGANHDVIVAICPTEADAEHIAAALADETRYSNSDGFYTAQVQVHTAERFDTEHSGAKLSQDEAQAALLLAKDPSVNRVQRCP